MTTTINKKEAIFMTQPDVRQLANARTVADDACALSAVAQDFKKGLIAYSKQEPARGGLTVSIVDSRTEHALNFRLATVQGEVEALFDHAFKDGKIVGRYRLFTVADMPSEHIESREVWLVLFNEYHRATWDPKDDFDWHFTPGHRDVPQYIGRFVQMLLFHIQATLPPY